MELLQTTPRDKSPMMMGLLDVNELRSSKDIELPKDPFSIENSDNWQNDLNRSELPIGLDLRESEEEERRAGNQARAQPIYSPSPGNRHAERDDRVEI